MKRTWELALRVASVYAAVMLWGFRPRLRGALVIAPREGWRWLPRIAWTERYAHAWFGWWQCAYFADGDAPNRLSVRWLSDMLRSS